jgi:hypothetical protein
VNANAIVDRTQTGPPKPSPSTGTVRAEDGSIVADSSTIRILPPTPVNVDLPSPFEPVIDTTTGKITPRWWRFLDQLYRRTGGVIDNINRVPTQLLGAGSVDALAFTGIVPTVNEDHIRQVGIGSVTATGGPVVVNPVPSLGSLTLTGEVPTLVP